MICSMCGVPEGLGKCQDCRELAGEILINTEILATVRDEALPTVMPRSYREHKSDWWLAVAATAVLALAVPVARFMSPAAAPSVHDQFGGPQPPTVKLLTSNPDVVIYWLVDSKENISR